MVEPARPLIEGWPLQAICEHLEAVTYGAIKRLLINIPPGFMKSLAVNVFWPAWEWGPMGLATYRYIAASYSQQLTVRDNVRFRNIITAPDYVALWGDSFKPSSDQFNIVKVANDKTGWKLATSVGGIGTGERGDRFIIDDGNSVKEAESEVVRMSTNQWFREVVPTRLNDADEGVIINVQQRTHSEDISGVALDKSLGYVHLMIPMEYNPSLPTTPTPFVGWVDPRACDEHGAVLPPAERALREGELAWPARFSARAIADLKKTMGPYAVSGQFQQDPTPRGGGIFKDTWWQLWESPDGHFPVMEFVCASLDPAYTSKHENDPSGFTVWGVFKDEHNRPKIILMNAWRKRLELHGPHVIKEPMETDAAYKIRAQPSWGLVEWVAESCRKFKVDTLLIESRASGLSVAQEIRRLYYEESWGVQLIDPKAQDKVARAYAVQHLFSEGLIYAPDRDWAQMVINEMRDFPKAPHDDLTDSATQALSYLRRIDFAVRKSEFDLAETERMRYKPQATRLYPTA